MSQNPNGGKLAKGETVTIAVSKGEDPDTKPIDIPNVVGMTSADAQTKIAEAGIRYNVVETSSDQPKGTVVKQSPSSGQGKKGDTITITVSTGPSSDSGNGGNNGSGNGNGNGNADGSGSEPAKTTPTKTKTDAESPRILRGFLYACPEERPTFAPTRDSRDFAYARTALRPQPAAFHPGKARVEKAPIACDASFGRSWRASSLRCIRSAVQTIRAAGPGGGAGP